MKKHVNPFYALSVPVVAIAVLVLWRSFHHDVSELSAVDKQPPGKYFLLLKEIGSGQHKAAIVVKSSDGKKTVFPGIAKGDINSPVANQRLITYSPTSEGCEGNIVELYQAGGTVTVIGSIDPGCSLYQELANATVLRKL